ncbi:hypothetical protein D9M72_536570 [compost metagenome]
MRIRSSIAGLADFRPCTMLTRVGKKQIRPAMMIFGAMPLPTSSTRIGASAMIGIDLMITAIG